MDLHARVDVNFTRVDENFKSHCDLFCYKIFILISVNTKVPLILHIKFQPNIPSHIGEMDLNARVNVTFFRVNINFQTCACEI